LIMRLRDITIRIVSIILAAVLLIAAGLQLDFINSQRKEMGLIVNEPLENAPPSLAFATVAMGAFRGLVVDILWLRADRLKEQGQYFDAKQLAEWITTLQPRFASVWEFHAWNMAYNISAAIPVTEPEQRWQWIKNGWELLRDEGIPLNPKAIVLYRQLALLFQHKISGTTDDAHEYYKLQLVEIMEPLLGAADSQYFKDIAEAPAELEQVINDANIAPLIKALQSADGIFADKGRFVQNYLSFRQNPRRFAAEAFKVIDSFRGGWALKKLDIFTKAWQLRNVWKLDPVLMQQLNKTYGPIDWTDPNTHLPLDWRHPDTHALYWAVKGLKTAGKKEYSIDETNTDRIVNHSLQNLFRNGKVFVYDLSDTIPQESSPQGSSGPTKKVFYRPDFRMFENYNIAAKAVLEKYKDIEKKGTYQSLKDGHRHMLTNAVLSFYQAGLKLQAQKIFEQLKELYPRPENEVSLVVFARNRIRDEFEALGINNAKEQILALLRESYFLYAIRDDDEAFGREKMAEDIYKYYQSIYSDDERIDLPDFKLLKYFAIVDFLYDNRLVPEIRRNLLGRIKIERPKLFEQFRQQAEKLKEQAEQQQKQAPQESK